MVSEEGKELIKKLLVVNPKMRITGEEALKDPWFNKFKNVREGFKDD